MVPFVYFVPVVALAVLGAILWYQQAPRRAALATLRSAIASTRAAPAAKSTLVARPVDTNRDAPVRQGAIVRQVVNSVAAAIGRPARHLCPPAYAASVRRRLTLAGHDWPTYTDLFLAIRLVSLVLVVPAFLLLLVAHISGIYGLLTFFFFVSALGLGPEAYLNRAVSGRQEQIRHDLPGLLELLMISVEAGLGFDQALTRSIVSLPGPLSEEFSRYLGEVRMGADHKEALEAIDLRTDVDELRSFVMALVQAETFGVSVGSILRAQAEQARVAQRQHVQELAQKAPVKMLFPLVFCVLPALFIVVVGPAAIEIYRTLIK
jgi:tight adherence protein C